MEWPPQSPDLNPIENLWDQIDENITSHSIKNKEDCLLKQFFIF